MTGFSQVNDLSNMLIPDGKDLLTGNLCNEIDEIMKHEQDDDISLDQSLSATALDLDLDSISDLLENPRSTSRNFIQTLSINDLSPTFTTSFHPNSLSNTTTNTSTYSSLTNSPKLIVPNSNNNQLSSFPSYIQQPENFNFPPSRSFEFQTNPNGPSDVKRFRSASMNDGPSLYPHQNIQVSQFSDPYRFKPSTYINPSTSDIPTSPTWSYGSCARPVSNSFSEVENHHQQQRLNPLNAFDRTTSSMIHPMRFSQTKSLPQQTLYSINQASNENFTPPTKKRLSINEFSIDEIKTNPTSPNGTIEQRSEVDLWSDIDQTSSEPFHDNDQTSGTTDIEQEEEEEERNTYSDYPKNVRSNSSPPRFWKYNVQSKGPKTKRMLYLKERDPHLQREFSDPVYQIKLSQNNGQNCNKLRKGDGNDVTPNPMKLYQLGKQIRELLNNTSSLYQGIYNVVQHSNANDSIEAKKEKNKLASKTCRLRKKAQHEANKLKLQGLNEEHKSLIDIITSIKSFILQQYDDKALPCSSYESALDQLIAQKYKQSVAGNADGFVESTINEIEKIYSQIRS